MSRDQSSEPAGTERNLRSTARNPRRRQRQSDNDSLKTAAPRRKRSKITDDTFKPRASTEVADIPLAEDENVVTMNGHSHPNANGHKHSNSVVANVDIPVRSKKSIAKRAGRHDGTTTLAQNQCYGVKFLSSTPKELRKEGVEYRGSLGPGNHALAVMHKKAIIWEYAGHTSSNTHTFDIPFATRTGEAIPFGALVSNGQSPSDLGLVLISASSAKIVFFENIDRAASLGLFQNQENGVEGVIGGLFSGESVVEVVSAEHAGFIIVLSSGRLAQLTLRDSQGKPRIFSQFLRIAEPASGGLFGSLKGFFNGGFKKDLSAVHTSPTGVRGQALVISLTESAEFLIWDVDWSGRAEFRTRIDFKELLSEEIKMMTDAPELQGKANNVAALDFAIISKTGSSNSQDMVLANAEQPLEMFLLARAGGVDMHDFFFIELALQGENIRIVRTAPLPNPSGQTNFRKQMRPRLILPKPGHTAFVQFEDALILHATKETAMDTPEAQLRSSLMHTDIFEDTLKLQSSRNLAFLDVRGEDSRTSNASCIAFVRGSGLVRVAVADVHGAQIPARISEKSRIEQGVFYGLVQHDNILDFSRSKDERYDPEEVKEAALAISDGILRAETSVSGFISSSPTQMDSHLAAKSQAIHALVTFVAQNYAALPRNALWTLLQDAEKVAAAQELWKVYELHVSNSMVPKRKATLLDEVCSWFGSEEDFAERKDLENEDPVRRFFIGGLYRLPKLLTNVRTLLDALRKDDSQSADVVLKLVEQANDIWFQTLSAAFSFRTENASAYGILPERIEDGLLSDPVEYVDAPAPWTSTEYLVANTAAVVSLSHSFATDLYEEVDLSEAAVGHVHEIAKRNPELIKLYCTQFRECIAWHASRPTENERAYVQKLEKEFRDGRHLRLMGLVDLGQINAGMKIAESLDDMQILAELVLSEEQWLSGSSVESDLAPVIDEQANMLANKIRGYFERYKEKWSSVFFDRLFSQDTDGQMLVHAQSNWKEELTSYLRANPSRAKLCWINDVTEQDDFGHAGIVLSQNATGRENRAWAKKVELSMSRLALIAAQEAPSKLIDGVDSALHQSKDELVLVELQEQLYELVYPEVAASIDSDATTTNVMASFGRSVRKFPALRHLLESEVDRLTQHHVLAVDTLIDVFTLMDYEEQDYQGRKFFLALQALLAAAPTMPAHRVEMLLRLIWKRCYASTNWKKLGLKGKSSDEERLEILRTTAAWTVLYLLQDSDLLSSGPIKILTPSECIGAGCDVKDFEYRFEDSHVLSAIVQDMQSQDDILRSYVEDCGLDEIVAECQRDVKAVLAVDAEQRALDLEEKREFEKGWTQEMAKLHAQLDGGLNGHHVNGFTPGEFLQEDGSDAAMSD